MDYGDDLDRIRLEPVVDAIGQAGDDQRPRGPAVPFRAQLGEVGQHLRALPDAENDTKRPVQIGVERDVGLDLPQPPGGAGGDDQLHSRPRDFHTSTAGMP